MQASRQSRSVTLLEQQLAAREAELEAASQALRAGHEQSLAFFDHAPVSILVSRDGVILAANAASRALFGYDSPQEMVGRLLIEHIAPAERALAIERAIGLASGAPAEAPMSFTGQRRDGTQFPAFWQTAALPF